MKYNFLYYLYTLPIIIEYAKYMKDAPFIFMYSAQDVSLHHVVIYFEL